MSLRICYVTFKEKDDEWVSQFKDDVNLMPVCDWMLSYVNNPHLTESTDTQRIELISSDSDSATDSDSVSSPSRSMQSSPSLACNKNLLKLILNLQMN